MKETLYRWTCDSCGHAVIKATAPIGWSMLDAWNRHNHERRGFHFCACYAESAGAVAREDLRERGWIWTPAPLEGAVRKPPAEGGG